MWGELLLIEKLEAENKVLRYKLAASQDTIEKLVSSHKELREEIAGLRRKHEPELEGHRNLGGCGI